MSLIPWLTKDEPLVGQGHATLSDTLNRVTRAIFSQSGYNPDSNPFPGVAGPVFNVKAFGAIGNGIADDTVAVQGALTAATTAGGGDVFVPPNTILLVSATLNLLGAGVHLVGSGWTSIIRAASPSFDLLNLGSAAHHAQVYNLQFQGAAVDTTTDRFAIMTPGSASPNDVTIRKVKFSGLDAAHGFNSCVLNDGLRDLSTGVGTAGTRWQVLDCDFDHPWGNQGASGLLQGRGYGVLLSRATNCVLIGNTFRGDVTRGRHFVYVAGSSQNVISSNIITNCDDCAIVVADYTGSPSSPQSEQNVITGNLILGGGTARGPLATGVAGIGLYGFAFRNLVVGNTVDGWHGVTGIDVNSAAISTASPARNSVAHNLVLNSQGFGIQLAGAKDMAVSGNVVRDASLASPGTYAAIKVVSDLLAAPVVRTQNVRIVNNDLSGPATIRCGIDVEGTTLPPLGMVIRGNDISDWSTYPIQVGTGVGPNIIIERNVFGGKYHISGDNGDASITFVVMLFEDLQYFNTPLTANRTVTLSASNLYKGARMRVVRSAAATGAFTLTVGTKALAAGQWVEFESPEGTSWTQTSFGSL